MSSNDNIYIVENLLKKRSRRGKTEYLVKWVGWSEQHNSWEPRNNILDKKLIEEFEADWSKLAASRQTARKSTVTKKKTESVTSSVVSSTPSPISSLFSPQKDQNHNQSYLDDNKSRNKRRKFNLADSDGGGGGGGGDELTSVSKQKSFDFDFMPESLMSPSFDDENEVVFKERVSKKPSTRKIPGAAKRSRVYPNLPAQQQVFVTEVTARNVTVMIAECSTPEGFFEETYESI